MRKFHRRRGPRRRFLKTLLVSLVMKKRMETTLARAKEVRPQAERLVTVGKEQSVPAFRRLLRTLPKPAAEKVFYEIAPAYKDRRGGYLRITKRGATRKRDGSETAVIEFI